ncbi:cytoplasmic phosphatidylinositol transfer protein 1b [Megalops cyprinoides]|uniref:cytoplasmic phosphatidylinositol transfer protein 1b n=1 Tax=Megalops cyprinoides TaxID=118141 RepID=UPI001864AE77|nr:cytoplasmic phosphatidylinositol transfer protein 1b [Megalops cyprinoides]
MLMKEYRICMPLTVDEYRIGQLYMISKHSSEQSGGGEGVEVICNEPQSHPQHGPGQMTEKRIYLSSKLPSWMRTFVPRIFYITEKAWNFYPYTITEYTCSFVPKFHIRIETKFGNDNGHNDNVFGDSPTPPESVSHLDILTDPIPEKHYKKSEDLSCWESEKTGRGPLQAGWRNTTHPIMCSYKRVQCSFEVYGLQGRTEEFIHKNIRDILLVGHRQAVAWTDEWHGMTLDEVRQFERELQEQTNNKVKSTQNNTGSASNPRPAFSRSISVTDEPSLKKMGVRTPTMPDSSQPPTPMRLHSTPE